ncbi:MAG: shikimate dehydrogenase [Planctomycetaceae bacterium]|jgi:3-dehydroquinate dehydratase/shikimate dehydrogenase|nr:shikimate dehydrogenase [Planctomycetaceae bacterium]
MFCVTIACGSHTRMIAEHQRLADDGVKLTELRLDFLRRKPELHRLIPVRPTAAVITIRRKQDGGLWQESEEQRQTLLRSAIAEQPEFIDIEVDIADKIPSFGTTRRIISYHNIEGMPDDLDALHQEMSAKSPFFIKIAVSPNNTREMLRFLTFIKTKNETAKAQGQNGIRVIGICMGELGKASRILAKKFAMPYTYTTFSEERMIAPGILEYRELRDVYHYEKINDQTDVFGVIGNPLGHSLSPLIHNRSFVEKNINAVYVPFQITGIDVPFLINHSDGFALKGLSVTIPHKLTVMHSLTRAEPAVEKIGACNTVVFRNGQRLGYNTDYTAAVSVIETALGGRYNDETSVVKHKEALILGCGGVGKALCFGLLQRGANVTVTDRKADKAMALASQLGCGFINWDERNVHKTDILVNGTSVGMYPHIDEMPLDKTAFHSEMLVFDAVYNPENTMLIKSARAKGCTAVTGTEMFVVQACLQFKLFTGQNASPNLMRDLVKNAVRRMSED